MDILKVPRIVRIQQRLFPGTSCGKSAGENAEAKNTFLLGTFLLKVPGKVRMQKNTFLAGTLRKYRTLFLHIL